MSSKYEHSCKEPHRSTLNYGESAFIECERCDCPVSKNSYFQHLLCLACRGGTPKYPDNEHRGKKRK